MSDMEVTSLYTLHTDNRSGYISVLTTVEKAENFPSWSKAQLR